MAMGRRLAHPLSGALPRQSNKPEKEIKYLTVGTMNETEENQYNPKRKEPNMERTKIETFDLLIATLALAVIEMKTGDLTIEGQILAPAMGQAAIHEIGTSELSAAQFSDFKEWTGRAVKSLVSTTPDELGKFLAASLAGLRG